MTSVSVRFEEMTASHRFELQSETKDDHQQSRKLRKCLSNSRCRNNRGNIIQLQKETALRKRKAEIFSVSVLSKVLSLD